MQTVIKSFEELTNKELIDILQLRNEIFVVEQNCIYQDIDGLDEVSVHVFLKDGDKIMSYLRVFETDSDTAKIGRVVSAQKRKGYGAVVMREGIKVAGEKLGKSKIVISAQVQALGFYETFGFKVVSEQYLEDGIPHKKLMMEVL